MLTPQNKIIIVDDVQDDLDTLSSEFNSKGIGCKTFLYDPNYNTPLNDVRLAFFDIELRPSGGGTSQQKFNFLALALKQYIHPKVGPFALIFWTKDTAEIENLKNYIDTRHTDCPKPFIVRGIDKGEFAADPSQVLNQAIDDSTIKVLFDFEDKAAESASETINQIYKIIPKQDRWGGNENFKTNFEKVFSKIATSTLGFKHAQANPTKAVYSALIPVLNYYIINSNNKVDWASILTSLREAKHLKELVYPIGFRESRLNSFFHIEDKIDINKSSRGAVIEYIIESPCENQYPLNNYFKQLEIKTDKLFDLFINFDFQKCNSEVRDRIRSESKFVLVEASAACDYSQDKERLHKYIFGLITPVIQKEYIHSCSACVFKLPTMCINNKEIQIWLNFNFAYGFDLSGGTILGKPLFLLKDEIMNMIGNHYANHVSRIGITSF